MKWVNGVVRLDAVVGAPLDVGVALGEGQGDALRDADVGHLERHALRGAHRDGVSVSLLVQLERCVAAAEIAVDVVAAVARAELERLSRKGDSLVADVHDWRLVGVLGDGFRPFRTWLSILFGRSCSFFIEVCIFVFRSVS